MTFKHKDYNARFLANPGQNDAWPKYGVEVIPAVVQPGQVYWRVIGIHHLLPEENMSNRNVFMDVLDEQGKRIKNPIIWAGWTWEGIQDHERADPTPLDKPDNETAGNISVGGNQKVAVWIKGRSRASNDKSDWVTGLHTGHPDEVLPDGRKLNTWGHHSFYVVFQRTVKTGAVETPPAHTPTTPPPIEAPPVDPPAATVYSHTAATFYLISADGVRIGQVISEEWAQQIVDALKLAEASKKDHRIESYVLRLKEWNEGEL